MPPRPAYKTPTVNVENKSLEDIPYHYFNKRSQWSDFRRPLNNCGLVWGLPDWSATILYGGSDWEELNKKHKRLKDIFAPPDLRIRAEKVDVSLLSLELLTTLGLAKPIEGDIQTPKKYCNLSTCKYEDDKKLPARQKMWSWFVISLQGSGTTTGPFYYYKTD